MDERFPELSSFGTLLKYALALEELAREHYDTLSARPDCAAFKAALSEAANRHRKRCKQLERYRKERLNELVLQPISGMARDEYLPVLTLPSEATSAVTAMQQIENQIARFYQDAVRLATNVLGGLDKSFRKLADDSLAIAKTLGD